MLDTSENKMLSSEQLIHQINELEDSYVAALNDGETAGTLNQVWHHIKQLHRELTRRRTTNHD